MNLNNVVLYLVAFLPAPPVPTTLDLELQACYPPRAVAMQRYQEACDYRCWLQGVKDAGVAWPGWQGDYERANELFHFHDYLTDAMSVDQDNEERKDFLKRARAIAVEMGCPANAWLPATPFR